MVAIDEAKLDQVYQKLLQSEKDIATENETLRRLGRDSRRMLRKQNEERRALREERYSELIQAAGSIFSWLTYLAENPKGRKILSTLGEVDIFCARYHNCKPTEWHDYKASLTYDRKGVLRYRETCRDFGCWQKVLGNPKQMVRQLHPNYIFSVLDDITTGKVWEQIELAT